MAEGRYLRPAFNTGGTYASIIRKLDGGEICRTQIRAMPFMSTTQASQVQEESSRPIASTFDKDTAEISTPGEEEPEDDEIPTSPTDQFTKSPLKENPRDEQPLEELRYEQDSSLEAAQEEKSQDEWIPSNKPSGEEAREHQENEKLHQSTETEEPQFSNDQSEAEPAPRGLPPEEEEELSALGQEVGKRRWLRQSSGMAVCGPEWGELAGRVAIVIKAVYGLVGSAHAYHRHVFDVMQSLGWKPCPLDNDIWLRKDKEGKLYDYIAFYVDDFIIVSNHPAELAAELGEIFSIKEIGPPSRYLGADVRWVDGYFHFSSTTYLTEVLDQLQRAGSLEEQPANGFKKFKTPYEFKEDDTTPLTPGDHPELDSSEMLDDVGHHLFQRMVGILQWIVLIGRYDVCYVTASMSRFGSAPRQGHLDRVKRIFGYLRANPNRAIRINPSKIGDLPSPMAEDVMENMRKAYPDAQEEMMSNDPTPLGKPLPITVFVDADHAHDHVTRKSITGMLAFVGCTPINAKSKRQTSVESSTYGAEFAAARSAVEYITGMRLLMRALGVPSDGPSILLGDNRGVVESASNFTTVLIKKHNAISYHRVREAVAAGIVDFRWIDGENNLADLMTKPVTKVTQNRFIKRFMY
jgi:hypothetical protein